MCFLRIYPPKYSIFSRQLYSSFLKFTTSSTKFEIRKIDYSVALTDRFITAFKLPAAKGTFLFKKLTGIL